VKGLLLFDPALGILTAQRFGGDFGGSGVGVHWLVVARSAVAAADDGTDAVAADVDADADADAAGAAAAAAAAAVVAGGDFHGTFAAATSAAR